MHLRFRKCTIDDLQTLIALSKETFIAAFERDNDPEDFESYITTAFSEEKLLKEIEHPRTDFYFIFAENILAGYFKINGHEAQSDPQDVDSLELERIYVLKEFQGKQIGASALTHIVKLAQKGSIRYLWLGVWEKNQSAIRFYERHGFKKFGKHPYYIGNDKQTDWLMRFDL